MKIKICTEYKKNKMKRYKFLKNEWEWKDINSFYLYSIHLDNKRTEIMLKNIDEKKDIFEYFISASNSFVSKNYSHEKYGSLIHSCNRYRPLRYIFPGNLKYCNNCKKKVPAFIRLFILGKVING